MEPKHFLDRLQGVKKSGEGWQAKCPAHEDRNASLSIREGDGGKLLIHCHAGCTPEAIVAAVGLKMTDLFPEKPGRNGKLGKIVAEYHYNDEGGKLLFEVVRYDPKDFRQRRPDPTAKDGWNWSLKGVRRVLFRLPEVLKAKAAGLPVILAEGEKDVLVLTERGFCATCNPGGAESKTDGKKWQASYTASLTGADVFIVPDADKPGQEHAALVARALQGKAASVRVVTLPAELNGRTVKDAFDYFAAGGDAAALSELLDAAPEWTPPAVLPAETTAPDANEVAPIEGRPLSALVRHTGEDPGELLRFRFLCRLGSLLLCGPTGIGKSALAMQLMLLWALCKEAFGIRPARPLKSLLIQAENDDGDIAEMRDGVIAGLKLTAAEAKQATESVIVWREDERTGLRFFAEVVRPLLEQHRPDVLWIDPALSYLGGETNSQKDVGGFLRNQLNPLLREFNCAAVVIHHTNKPPAGREKAEWQAGDFAYLGSGSAEWANWARAVLALRSIGSNEVFELRAGKRGSRIGWKEADGSKAFVRHIAHAKEPGVICWREADEAEATQSNGRPKQFDADEVFALLPPEGLTAGEWQQAALKECGIKEASFHRFRRELANQKRVLKSKVSGKWQPLSKP